MTKFQAAIIGIFVLFIFIGVAVFATYKGNSTSQTLPQVTVWGTFPATTFNQLVAAINITQPQALRINYTEMTPAQFDKTFIETLARGGGPDAVLLPQEMLLKHIDKVVAIPATVMTDRTFLDTYIDEANNYITPNGILALPFTIDPLMMYWNKDIFTNAGIPTYPKFWDELDQYGKFLTVKDNNSNVRRSSVALGEFRNVTHAREVLGSLLMQAGNPVLRVTTEAGANGPVSVAQSTLALGEINGLNSASNALTFYNQFSNPASGSYAWNRSLPQSKSAFLSGTLATYFGFASELAGIRAKNPNLNFDVAGFPQARKGQLRVTYGTMYGLSIVRSTPDATATYNVLSNLFTPDAVVKLMSSTYLPPVRRDTIAQGNSDPYLANFYDSALISKGWLDPNPQGTSDILQEMVESVTSGRKVNFEAIKDADTRLNLLIRSI
jgi:ABC-type glycerol-3-phosphate transport system substrate-binding protein